MGRNFGGVAWIRYDLNAYTTRTTVSDCYEITILSLRSTSLPPFRNRENTSDQNKEQFRMYVTAAA